MTEPMNPAEIAAMVADMQAGTPGPWPMETVRTSCGVCHKIGPWPHNWRAGSTMSACIYDDYPSPPAGTYTMLANASRIARVPAMEQTILALQAQLAAMTEARDAAVARVVTQAERDVLAERQRQISAEGWTPEHDDEHADGEMARAAACYALAGIQHWAREQAIASFWPWEKAWWKPTDPRRDLVKAGALILAEIERLDRKEGTPT